jgi:serine/threonine protein kinase
MGQTILDQFRVEEYLASGGMGSVYKVWDLKRNVMLAMKVLHADFADDPSAFKYFQREARALQKLRHPNIVPFYGLFQTEEFTFLLEQYIDGPSLREVLKTNSAGLPLAVALTYMSALCSALGYAHLNGVVHCDIKPANVMAGKDGRIYLADFGIARHADSTTTTIAGAGTPAYMAPEQIRNIAVSPAADVYSLGVLFFELLTGQRPFRGDEAGTLSQGDTSGERIRYSHLHLPPPDPCSINPSISSAVAAIILRCMAKSPDDRYSSAGELLIDLQGLGIPFHEKAEIIPVETNADSYTGIGYNGESHPLPKSNPEQFAKLNSNIIWVGWAALLIIGLGVISILGVAIIFANRSSLPAAQMPSSTDYPTSEIVADTPASTILPIIIATAPLPTATEELFPLNQSDGAELVFIPAGKFIYGININTDPYFMGAEIPQHEIYLDSYSIYRTEVTNGMYEKCVQEKGCPRPEQNMTRTISSYYGNPRYADYPVIFVSWVSAQSYCVWADGRLPTEAEWEKAARGEDGRQFPWGNSEPENGQINMCDSLCADTANQLSSYHDDYIDVAPVGAHPESASPYGVLDMSGNVWEWVSDWIIPGYLSSDDNPVGPASGSRRVIRGGSWRNSIQEVRSAVRASMKPDATLDTLGFRCAVPGK